MTPKEQWKAARAALDAAEIAHSTADKALKDVEDQFEGSFLSTCMCCGEPIFDGDKYTTSADLELCCDPCSPTYQDMLDRPDMFLNNQGEPMTAGEVRVIVDEHIAAGGVLTDTMAEAD